MRDSQGLANELRLICEKLTFLELFSLLCEIMRSRCHSSEMHRFNCYRQAAKPKIQNFISRDCEQSVADCEVFWKIAPGRWAKVCHSQPDGMRLSLVMTMYRSNCVRVVDFVVYKSIFLLYNSSMVTKFQSRCLVQMPPTQTPYRVQRSRQVVWSWRIRRQFSIIYKSKFHSFLKSG
jgi:hypothetical protein